jgi:uncharacterized protein YbbK (DUF523 family)
VRSSSKILISACLLGQPVRFDGQSKQIKHSRLQHWEKQGRLLALCPEVIGGLSVPRPAAEITACRAEDVIDGSGSVLTEDGEDVSQFFICGAKYALGLCRQNQIRLAILKENSPSCGSTQVYDGGFNAKLIPGAGITSTLLRQNGIAVFNELEIDAAADYLESIKTS